MCYADTMTIIETPTHIHAHTYTHTHTHAHERALQKRKKTAKHVEREPLPPFPYHPLYL